MMLSMKPSKHFKINICKDSDTHKDSLSFPFGFTEPVQYEEGGPWMHGFTKEANNSDHYGRSYVVRVIKRGKLIM